MSNELAQVHAQPPQVLAPLPGEDAEDTNLIETAVADINDAYRRGGLETARQIGELVVQRFFDGDPANAHSRKRKHKSYQALSKHAGLAVGATTLWYCVATFEQYGQLPVAVAEKLTTEHYRVLAHVADRARCIELAEAAARNGWAAEKLKAEVALAIPAKPNAKKRGRKPLVPLVKEVHQAKKVVDGLQKWDAGRIAGLDAKGKLESLALARQVSRAVAEWLAALEANAGEVLADGDAGPE